MHRVPGHGATGFSPFGMCPGDRAARANPETSLEKPSEGVPPSFSESCWRVGMPLPMGQYPQVGRVSESSAHTRIARELWVRQIPTSRPRFRESWANVKREPVVGLRQWRPHARLPRAKATRTALRQRPCARRWARRRDSAARRHGTGCRRRHAPGAPRSGHGPSRARSVA